MIKELILEKAVSDIKKDCSKFLSEVTKPLYRGMSGTGKDIGSGILLCKVRTDRTPKDIDDEFHEILDNFFKKKYNIKFRSSAIFCSFDKDEIESYGELYKIYPIGNYDYIWSPYITDVYTVFDVWWGAWNSKFKKMFDEICDDLNIKSELEKRTRLAGNSIERYLDIASHSERFLILEAFFNKFGEEIYHFNEKINDSTDSEIMISCNQYYAVPIDLEIEL